MRLSTELKEALIGCIEKGLEPPKPSQLYLFGSRTDDQKKGGDIDLLLVVSRKEQVADMKRNLHELKAGLREAADDQRVDLSITTEQRLATDPFFSSLDKKILLKSW